MARDRDIDRIERPDIELGAVVRAKRVRFGKAPRTEVSFEGDEDSVSGSERENLPERVEPGVDYRNVRIRWRAAARAAARRTRRLRRL